MKSGRGCYVTSLDGMHTGHTLGAPNELEVQLARLLVNRFPSLEMVEFANSGTEANAMAIAVAQNYAKKKKILAFENGYHGSLASFFKAPAPLLLPHPFVLGRFKDIERGCIPGTKEFLTFLRSEATRVGAIPIFDEVVTSRLYYGGVQEHLGIIPDMTTIGKFWGGGFSFGCYGGRREIMQTLDCRQPGSLHHSGTWFNNIWVFTRGRIESTSHLGDRLREEMQQLFLESQRSEASCPMLQVTVLGSVIGIHSTGPDATRIREAMYYFFLERRIYIAFRGFVSLNITHTAEHTARFMGGLREFVAHIIGICVLV
ncbi:pyridoxal phosphate-dependent transferase [Aspergillus venezuelensis]